MPRYKCFKNQDCYIYFLTKIRSIVRLVLLDVNRILLLRIKKNHCKTENCYIQVGA